MIPESFLKELDHYTQLSYELKSENLIILFGGEKRISISVTPDEQGDWILQQEWLQYKSTIVISKIVNRLGLSERLHARKCQVTRIDKTKAQQFLNKYHFHGASGSKYRLGLIHDDELVALATFSTPRLIESKKSAGLSRFCVKEFYSIPGGLDKLLKFYIRNFPCDNIFTFVDTDWSGGEGFKKVGFKEVLDSEGDQMMRLRLTLNNH